MFYGIKSSAFLLHETKIRGGGSVDREGGGGGGSMEWKGRVGGKEMPFPQLLGNDTSLLLA